MQCKYPFILAARDSLPHLDVAKFKNICEDLGYTLKIISIDIDGREVFKGEIYSGNILITQSVHEEGFIEQHHEIVGYIQSHYIKADNGDPIIFFW